MTWRSSLTRHVARAKDWRCDVKAKPVTTEIVLGVLVTMLETRAVSVVLRGAAGPGALGRHQAMGLEAAGCGASLPLGAARAGVDVELAPGARLGVRLLCIKVAVNHVWAPLGWVKVAFTFVNG